MFYNIQAMSTPSDPYPKDSNVINSKYSRGILHGNLTLLYETLLLFKPNHSKGHKSTYLLSFNILIVLNFENISKMETKRDVKKHVTKQTNKLCKIQLIKICVSSPRKNIILLNVP
jgi:hypothetical protein